MISVIVLTKNEEKDLAACLESVNWCDDIHVVDSGSTDKTLEIALAKGATVTINKFKSFGQQRNFALDKLQIKNKWIFFLDADEVISEKFRLAMFETINNAADDVAGFYCCWKMILDNKWLKYSDNFPKWQFRLMSKGRARFKDFGHGQKEDDVFGSIGYIREPYLHYGFSKGWSHWIDRHNRYSSSEALARISNRPPFKNILSKHGSVRNPALKSWLSKLPGWPFFRFFYTYVLRGGFLEGTSGFIYCINMGYYEFLIKIKMREIKKDLESKTKP
ncbi:MAG: glycosyltransferase family 2 protein [Ginsengibacter sp.]